MNLGGDTTSLEHVGVKGMRWGVRKTPAEQQQRAKEKAVKKEAKAAKKADKAFFNLESRMSAGEAVVSLALAGPVGLIVYNHIKNNAAETKRKHKNLSAQKQQEAAAKIGVGKAIAVTALTGPVGFLGYAAAKTATSRTVDDF
jgi:hypothetical protein